MHSYMRCKRKCMGCLMLCVLGLFLFGCGSDKSVKKGNVVSNTKSVDQVLDEQVSSQENTIEESSETNTDAALVGSDDAASDTTQTTEYDPQTDTKQAMDEINTNLDDASKQASATSSGDVDVDLTQLSSTLVYSEVYNMVMAPADYMGKKVRMKGTTTIYHDDVDNNDYYACVIQDATACCAQGIEFVLNDGNYPAEGSEVTVVGTFSSYKIGENEYYTLKDAVME